MFDQSQDRPFKEPWARCFTWGILVVTLLAALGFCGLTDFSRLLIQVNDDAYYTLKISENVAKGNGDTCDGIHRTSGYQPLWMLATVPVFCVYPDAPESALRVALGVQAILLFVAGLLMVSVLSRLFSWRAVLGSAACYAVLVFLRALNGMEAALVIFSLVLLFAYGYYARLFFFDSVSVSKEFLFGLLLGVVMLSRLDTVFLARPSWFFAVGPC